MSSRWREIYEKLTYDRSSKETWKCSHHFLFASIASMYTFTTVIDFTRLVFSWGGLFLIQYLILLFTVGFPMIYVESVLGQFSKCSAVYVFNVCPAAVGLGIGTVIYAFIASLYHYVFILYSLTYAFFSCYMVLPWSACISWWNPSENCFVFGKKLALPSCNGMKTNFTVGVDCKYWSSSADEFWSRYVLGDNRNEFSLIPNIKWSFTLMIIMFWVWTFIVSSKGIPIVAKISWLLVFCTSLLLFVLSVFSLTLDGASRGLTEGFTPKFDSAINMNSWKEAAVHVIVSLNINYGIMATYSSCNHFHHKLYRNLSLLCLVVVLSSVCACIFVFCLVGNMAYKLRKTIEELMASHDNWSLCFVLIPQALSNVFWPQLWSFLFFLFLSLLPFALHFSLLQVILISIFDGVPRLQSVRKWICSFICIFGGAVGLSFSSHRGKQVYDFIIVYCMPSIPFSFLFAVGKIIIVTWIYGWRNFLHDVEFMLGLKHSWLLAVCLSFIDPFTIFFLFIHCAWDFFLDSSFDAYTVGSQIVGWFFILIPVLPALIGFISDVRKNRKHQDGLFSGFEATHAWGPSTPVMYQDYYDWLKEKPEYVSVQTRFKRRHTQLTDDEIVRRRKAAMRRRLSVVTDSLMKLKSIDPNTTIAEMPFEESTRSSSVSKSRISY